MSPHIQIEVRNVTYNTNAHELFVEVIQEFHIRWNPLPAVPSRSVLFIFPMYTLLPRFAPVTYPSRSHVCPTLILTNL